jgi:phosphoribosylaminoimidazole-succinocarboxamide synthase
MEGFYFSHQPFSTPTKMNALKETDFKFSNQTGVYKGKVRDVYFFGDSLAMVATDRISAFDHVLPRAIPFKGQVLNQMAAKFLAQTTDILPNWVHSTPHPNVTVGKKCETFPVEMVIRGYLVGHAWRVYKSGERMLCGVKLPDGLKENEKLPNPIITPTTKAQKGHDEDISRQGIIRFGLVAEKDYEKLESLTHQLFERGTEIAAKKGLILVDTKYEFGKFENEIHLIDEVHTPDSSRYFYSEGYEGRLQKGETQRQLSKEFVREWLMENGFQGKENQQMPELPDSFVNLITERYIELYEKITGEKFHKKGNTGNLAAEIEVAISKATDAL